MSSSKIREPLELWERCERKLIVYVLEGVSLVTKYGAGNPYVKLIYDKQKQKTQVLKHAEDARWKEIFYFDVNNDVSDLMLEVWTKGGLGGDKLIGSCKIVNPNELEPDRILDRIYDLELPSNVKTKDKDALDARMGNVHLRLYFSSEREIPQLPPPNQCYNYFYRHYIDQMQTGDLILYSGVGAVDALSKIYSGTNYSRVGIVVRMPNKWTGEDKLFVFEVTRNIPKELDAFKDTVQPGANFFRLAEHLHIVNATTVWWVALKTPLEQSASENMVDWLKEYVSGSGKATCALPAAPKELDDFFDRFAFTLNKSADTMAELCSSSIAISALRLGGKRFTFENSFLPVVHIMTKEIFGEQVVLKERNGVPLPAPPPTGNLANSAGSTTKLKPSRDNRSSMMTDAIAENSSSGSANDLNNNSAPLRTNGHTRVSSMSLGRSSGQAPQNGERVSPPVGGGRTDTPPNNNAAGTQESPPSYQQALGFTQQPPAPSNNNLPVYAVQPRPLAVLPAPTNVLGQQQQQLQQQQLQHPPAPSNANLPVYSVQPATSVVPTTAVVQPSDSDSNSSPEVAGKPKRKKFVKSSRTKSSTEGAAAISAALPEEEEEVVVAAAAAARSPNLRLPVPTGRNMSVTASSDGAQEFDKKAVQKNSPRRASQPNSVEPSRKKSRDKSRADSHADSRVIPDPDAISENLDPKTKSEIEKRRRSSVKMMPSGPSMAFLSVQKTGESPRTLGTISESGPAAAPDANIRKALVLWSFDAENEGELNVKEGDAVLVLEEANEWAFVDKNGNTGAVPISYLSIV